MGTVQYPLEVSANNNASIFSMTEWRERGGIDFLLEQTELSGIWIHVSTGVTGVGMIGVRHRSFITNGGHGIANQKDFDLASGVDVVRGPCSGRVGGCRPCSSLVPEKSCGIHPKCPPPGRSYMHVVNLSYYLSQLAPWSL